MECTCHHHHHQHPIHRCHRPSFVLLRERERYHVCHRFCVCVCLPYFLFLREFFQGDMGRGGGASIIIIGTIQELILCILIVAVGLFL